MTEPAKRVAADRERLPKRREHTSLNIEAGGFRYVAGVGYDADGPLPKSFCTQRKAVLRSMQPLAIQRGPRPIRTK
jgi:hypothetical protein